MINRYLAEVSNRYRSLGATLESAIDQIVELQKDVNQFLYLLEHAENLNAKDHPKDPD